MKIGMRTPSLKRSLKARTTSKWKRQMKKAVIPGYGQKGIGWIKNPKKAMYNKVYRKTTFGLSDIIKSSKKKNSAKVKKNAVRQSKDYTAKDYKQAGIVMILLGLLLMFTIPFLGIFLLVLGIISFGVATLFSKKYSRSK
ncbi:TM2 domain-containing protein [Streptococcus anginosus]|uniref:TM2 domain-containing protein n=1 Tax=Streptococcus anginosus TaxID=1328 RepID=UPI003D366DF8